MIFNVGYLRISRFLCTFAAELDKLVNNGYRKNFTNK